MATMHYFAVAGIGKLGRCIVEELVNEGANVIVLTRGKNDQVPAGVASRVVDYDNVDALAHALQGIEVLVSVIGGNGYDAQYNLANAAKQAGVKLFVPSEFGSRAHELGEDDLLFFKKKLQQHLRSIGIPHVRYYVGIFSDDPLGASLGFDLRRRTGTIVGTGRTPISWTTRADIGRFVAYTLTHLSLAQLNGSIIGIEGSSASLLDVVTAIERHKLKGAKLKLAFRDVGDVEDEVHEKGWDALGSYVHLLMERGLMSVGVYKSNEIMPGFNPLDIVSAIQRYY